ncbi:MAG: hypothetical protein H7Z37_00945 [Pyrinomonadaceae bacterium]|nr:hypothetical protein [Pyrinomonadaceae bacterium]
MKRVVILSLLVLMFVGIALPFTIDWSEASKTNNHRKNRRYKKYSKGWWRAYHAKRRRQRAMAARKRTYGVRRARLAQARRVNRIPSTPSRSIAAGTSDFTTFNGETPPNGWRGESTGNGDAQFKVSDTDGRSIGSASLSVVSAAMPMNEENMPEKMREKTLGGVPVSALRRTVIDKMIREEGWIVNDYQRKVGGKRVFVVVAQTAKNNAVSSSTFYFTEVDGRIYSLATNSPTDFSDKIAADSEQFLTKFNKGSQSNGDSASTATTPNPLR